MADDSNETKIAVMRNDVDNLRNDHDGFVDTVKDNYLLIKLFDAWREPRDKIMWAIVMVVVTGLAVAVLSLIVK